jgi:Calcineurin-like phosphoesterase
MAIVAVGDIHGNLAALVDLLEQLRGDLTSTDIAVFLGDYIDRGPDSRGCVEAILSFRDERRCRVVCLCGNHEDWMRRTQHNYRRHSWLMAMEALTTIRSYSEQAEAELRVAMSESGLQLYLGRVRLPYDRFFASLPQAHRAFFDDLEPCFEADGCFCSHAGVDPRVAILADQKVDALLWGVERFPDGYRGDATVVYGHWNNAVLDGAGWPAPRIVGNTIGIDTIFHGVLTAIRLPDRRIFQSKRYRAS